MCRSLVICALSGIVLAGLIARDAIGVEATTTAPATVPATRPAPRPLADLFRVSLRDRKLDVSIVPGEVIASGPIVAAASEAVAEPTTASFEFTAPSEEKWLVQASPRDRRRDGSFATFAVACDSRSDDHWSPMQLTGVTCDASALTISGGGRSGRGFVAITYRQDARLRDVRFTVQRPRRLRPRPLHEFAAADILQLYNEHQQELRQYLLPLLKEACGDNPLRPRAGDVYRAFPSIEADAAVVERVRALLPELDAAAPPQREAASAKLRTLGAAGVLAAARIDRSDLTPGQAARLDAFVAQSSTWPDPLAAARKDAYFLVDCLQDEDQRVRAAALGALRAIKGSALTFDVAAAPAVRAKAVEALYDKLDDERDALPPEAPATPAPPPAP